MIRGRTTRKHPVGSEACSIGFAGSRAQPSPRCGSRRSLRTDRGPPGELPALRGGAERGEAEALSSSTPFSIGGAGRRRCAQPAPRSPPWTTPTEEGARVRRGTPARASCPRVRRHGILPPQQRGRGSPPRAAAGTRTGADHVMGRPSQATNPGTRPSNSRSATSRSPVTIVSRTSTTEADNTVMFVEFMFLSPPHLSSPSTPLTVQRDPKTTLQVFASCSTYTIHHYHTH